MLLELRVENYAVIDNLAVEFAPGLNLLTGETGAGKSILIDALSLLLGEKASVEVIRHGAEKAVVSGVFEVESKRTADLLEANGLDAGSPGELIVRREVLSNGRGRVFVNNQPATVAVLKQLSPHLASVHAQNESILAFDAVARLELLDAFGGHDLDRTEAAFARWKSIRQRMDDLQRDEQDRLRLVDLWSFQKKEIDEASLQPGEDERLLSEKRVLANAEKIHAAAQGAFELLYDNSSSTSATLRSAVRNLEELARYDPRFQESVAALESARITIEDLASTLRDYAGGIDASPERLAHVEDRLALLDRLKRKYGATVAEVLAHGAEASRKLGEMENKDEILRQLQRELGQAASEYLEVARALSRERAASARKLEKLVESEVNDLAMKARFHIELSGSDDGAHWSATGFDQAAYLIATNPGEPLHPVEKIASGGELARVLLALKATVETAGSTAPRKRKSDAGPLRTLVFDEIDTGIGGRAAEAVGKKLKALARTTQVLCITHLPQIASFADHHYVIEKKVVSGRPRTTVRRLAGEERSEEIARMLSGAKLTETSLRHAEQMLKTNA